MAELIRNASSERQVRNADRLEREFAKQFDADVKAVLATDEGVRVWCALMEQFSAWTSVLADKPHVMAYRAGQRDTGIQLYAIASSAGAMIRIAEEHARRQKLIAPQENEPDE